MEECKKGIEALISNPSEGLYKNLQEVTLIMTLLSSKRRSEEIANLQLCAFNESVGRLSFPNKKGTFSVVLLTPLLQRAFKTLIAKRNIINYPEGSTNFFAFPTFSTMEVSEVLKKMVVKCGAHQPNLLTPHGLRMANCENFFQN